MENVEVYSKYPVTNDEWLLYSSFEKDVRMRRLWDSSLGCEMMSVCLDDGGALDLTGSGGRLLLRRQTSKATLNPKTLADLLSKHLKSETAAADALKFITEHRETKMRESLLYERE